VSITGTSLPIEQPTSSLLARLADYVELTKPRIALLILVTVAAAGTMASWGQPDLWLLLHSMVGIALVAASASALNHCLEKDLDARMKRTASRPLPSGRITVRQACIFAAMTIVAGCAYLAITTNLLTLAFALATWLVYAWIYTPLKSRTTSNTAIGAISGAMPICIGWAAQGGQWDARAGALFLVLFLWQFPHFMAIAWLHRREYEEAGFKMLTVADPSGRRAGVQAVLSALVLLPVSFVPALVSPTAYGSIYVAFAFVMGSAQLGCAIRFLLKTDDASARVLLRATLIYLPLLMALLIIFPLL
jgi:protoheme IX farnesyltransferase